MSHDQIEPLITECPNCRTRFRVSKGQLQRARGRVRCGACLHVFDGVDQLTPESVRWQADQQQARLDDLDTLLEELGPRRPHPSHPTPLFGGFEDPEPTAARSAAPPEGGQLLDGAPTAGRTGPAAHPAVPASPPTAVAAASPEAVAVAAAIAGPIAGPVAGQEPASTGVVTENPTSDGPAVAVPELARAEPQPIAERLVFGEPRSRHPWLWAGVPILLLLLAGQVLWYQFDDWSKEPQWRGVYEVACRALGCELPVRSDASLLSTRNLAVRSDPARPGLLLLNAVIVNDADFPQAFPLLELRFTTLRGILVAGRRYHPEEYLSGDAAGLQLIPPKTPVQVELSIDDPGPEAVNYSLRLR